MGPCGLLQQSHDVISCNAFDGRCREDKTVRPNALKNVYQLKRVVELGVGVGGICRSHPYFFGRAGVRGFHALFTILCEQADDI